MTLTRRTLAGWALAGALPARLAAAPSRRGTGTAEAVDTMVRLDALYIPALSLTSAAMSDPRAAPRAVAAQARLRQAWPALRDELAARPPVAGQAAAWRRALQRAGAQITQADAAVARGDWSRAHEALEPVREALMQVRRTAGFEYHVDRLTAFHAPMEDLVLAGSKLQPGAVDAATRSRLERSFAEARARWLEVERHPADATVHRLSAARAAQLRQGLAGVDAALARLSDALRGSDNTALLAALRGVKPPFARSFTAFGLADGESLS